MVLHSISMGVIMKDQNNVSKNSNGFFKILFYAGVAAAAVFAVLVILAMFVVPFYRSVKTAGLILFIVSALFSLAIGFLARRTAYIEADNKKVFEAYNELIEKFNALEESVNATKAEAEAAIAEVKAAPKAAAPKAAPVKKAEPAPVEEAVAEAPAKKPAAKKTTSTAKKSTAKGDDDVAALTKEVAKLNLQVANLNGGKPAAKKTTKTAKKD